MHGGRLSKEELEIIERTKEEGRELHAGDCGEGAGGGKIHKQIRGITGFYLWLIIVFFFIITAISLMVWLLPGTGH